MDKQVHALSVDRFHHRFVERAEACGCEAIVVTLDTTLLGWRTRDLDIAYLPFLRGKGIAQYTSDPVFRRIIAEEPFRIEAADGKAAWIHEFTLDPGCVPAAPSADLRRRFEEALLATWAGTVESDGSECVMARGAAFRVEIDGACALAEIVEDGRTGWHVRPGDPAELVRIYKALGDESRLKLLKRLHEGPISLTDAAQEVGLAKSTTHHHLAILRQAAAGPVHHPGRLFGFDGLDVLPKPLQRPHPPLWAAA